MTKILQRTPRFMQLRYSLLEAIWSGREAVALQYHSTKIHGQRATAIKAWEPRGGDKLVFRYSDGTGKYQAGQVGIKVGMAGQVSSTLKRSHLQYTENGIIYWLSDWERKLIAVHKHCVEDGIFDDPYSSGSLHGVGVRSRIYWTWYAMVECLQRVLEYLDRSAFGVELWRYPAANPIAKAKTEEAAKRTVTGGRSVVMVPTYPNEQGDLYGVEHIEPGLAGVDKVMQVIREYFGHKIKRYISGQTLTSEAEATGMGSGVAEAHLATFHDIVSFDARNLEETITEDILRPMQLWNLPGSEDCYLRFVIDTEAPDAQQRLQAMKNAWDMGLAIKDSDIADAVGVSMPTPDDKVVFNPQIYGAIQQTRAMQQGGGAPIPTDAAWRALIEGAIAKAGGAPQEAAAEPQEDTETDHLSLAE